ncbi:hypothetical protein FHS43_000633 [Streptosporangium becharense]|uniref:Uncharacterized protein n=1 Tax=Streptosporangium becharense TaxID=1816182 RepID=A0A7W9MGL2_9ACTN|nr:hypothetical protein [Streptosporangium becharense]MBB2909387.1 hypothetical protein [Streptosporangium becharense]MBB5819656.1 hypothetical protein [Streptosporangium becharense]
MGLVAGALATLSPGSARAENAELVVDYKCTGGIALNGGTVNLRTRVSIPTTLKVGEPLSVGWKLGYMQDPTRFGSPDYFAPGAQVKVTGNVQLSGIWTGVLQPIGSVTQPNQLQPGTILKLPEGIADAAHTHAAGTLKVTPRKLFVDFTPPASEVMVNDDDPRVQYETGYWEDLNDQPANNNDHHHDIHRTVEGNARASLQFTGTGIEYVAQRDHRAGKVKFYIDGQLATPASVDASKLPDGTPSNDANRGGLTLWRFLGLDYGKHTIQVVNEEHGKWAQLDAFRVITRELKNPPNEYRATCDLVSAPVSVNVVISDGASQSPTPTSTGTVDPTGTPTITPTGTPTTTSTGTPTGGPTTPGPTNSTPTGTGTTPPPGGAKGTSTTTSTPKPTLTVTATVTPTRPTPTTPQVIITPSGGAQTGEAPDQGGSGLGLVGAGTAMVAGSVFGGVALIRRRAAHARGQG